MTSIQISANLSTAFHRKLLAILEGFTEGGSRQNQKNEYKDVNEKDAFIFFSIFNFKMFLSPDQ